MKINVHMAGKNLQTGIKPGSSNHPKGFADGPKLQNSNMSATLASKLGMTTGGGKKIIK